MVKTLDGQRKDFANPRPPFEVQAALLQDEPVRSWADHEVTAFISRNELITRTHELAEAIAEDYRSLGVSHEKPLHLLGVLKGVVPFMADLMRAIPTDVPVSVDFLSVVPYGPDTRNTG